MDKMVWIVNLRLPISMFAIGQEVNLKFRHDLYAHEKHQKEQACLNYLLVEGDGQCKPDIATGECSLHNYKVPITCMIHLNLAAWFWTVSSKAQSFAIWGFHMTQDFHAQPDNAPIHTSFTSAEHLNIAHQF